MSRVEQIPVILVLEKRVGLLLGPKKANRSPNLRKAGQFDSSFPASPHLREIPARLQTTPERSFPAQYPHEANPCSRPPPSQRERREERKGDDSVVFNDALGIVLGFSADGVQLLFQ